MRAITDMSSAKPTLTVPRHSHSACFFRVLITTPSAKKTLRPAPASGVRVGRDDILVSIYSLVADTVACGQPAADSAGQGRTTSLALLHNIGDVEKVL